MPIIQDEEFGKITIRRSSAATHVKVRAAPDGTLHASLPMYAPLFLVKSLLKSSRLELRKIVSQAKPEYAYINGMQIGKSHTLIIHEGASNQQLLISRHGQQIIVKLPIGLDINNNNVAREIRNAIISALRLEAKSYLPRRLSFLANRHDYSYNKVRFSHSGSRWGSCSSSGTISLNIALMKLSFELIDYILIHELSHTVQMNHSSQFWDLVRVADPDYKEHRKALKLLSPTI